MQVSHETIYRALYVQARGALKRELTRHLRRGRSEALCPLAVVKAPGPGKAHRDGDDLRAPAEVEDRAVPGHWEGDLLMGTRRRSAIATLVERSTRYCQLVALPEGTGAERGRDALAQSITTLPAQLRRSLTWDQGSEMCRAPALLGRDRGRRLLLRSPQPLAARLEREHQRPASPVLPEGQEPRRDHPGAPRRGRRQAQRPAAKDARLRDPGREARRADRRAREPAPSADLASAYGLRSTALEPDGTIRNVKGGALTG